MLDVLYLSSRDFSPQGQSAGLLTYSGGAGIWAADKCEEMGFEVPELEEVLPEFGSALNPVDVTGQLLNEPALLKNSLKALSEDRGVDFLVVIMGVHHKHGTRLWPGR